MNEERRKYTRYKCLLPAVILMAEGRDKLIKRTSVHDFSRGGLKLVVKFISLEQGSNLDLKLYIPEKELNATLKAEIAWKKFDDNKIELGLKIIDMEEEKKNEILNWIALLEPETNSR